MKKITTILVLICIISTASAQNKEMDYELYAKIEGGQYPTQAYLKGLIENQYIEDDFKSFFTENNDFKSLLAIGLINSILVKDYGGKYVNTQYFERLKYFEFEKTMYFYENCALRGNNELFIWGTYDKKADTFNIQSRVLPDIEPTFYEFKIISMNSKKLISFRADELAVIGTEESETWTTINYTVPNDSNFNGVFRDCKIENDTTIKCERLQWKGTSDEIQTDKRVFTSPLYLDDLNQNGTLDFYWFAVSDGSLVHLECYEFINTTLRQKDNNGLIEILRTTENYKNYIQLSKMDIKPKI